ncbi:hypothetical protein [Pseudoxanthomonas suwonensis]|uniref:Uncharacterized protein n=1 Tax=Pseudoxanthomonas suwonensis TaxID=314722 RepID=A0A0E3Z2W6_9GAMM|nr:hypothetical protein [Pseudoxanthomonas suwonensis]AKC87084.1 hypothetical protein WQ53_10335 [Pseudoxanthomonas suwonensis]
MATRKPIKSVPPRRPAGEPSKPTRALTSERISDDLAAFERAGGQIEVLGTTRVLQRVAELEAQKAQDGTGKGEGGSESASGERQLKVGSGG